MYQIVIGNKNYSTWSLRGWLAVRASGAPFEEIIVPMETDDWDARIDALSPSRRVPVLWDGKRVVWDSLAIIEYLAERHPKAGYWPEDPDARAHARCSAAEMHSGFTALRSACPMNFRRPARNLSIGDDVRADVDRIAALWAEARKRFGSAGPYLYGPWSAADMMYAPVVSRLRTYNVDVPAVAADYMASVERHAHYVEWREAGLQETWIVPSDELD